MELVDGQLAGRMTPTAGLFSRYAWSHGISTAKRDG
jgi:hypothetical protein